MNTIGNCKIPKHETDQNTLEILRKDMKKMDTTNQISKCDFYIKIGNVISTIGAKRIKYFNSIKLIYEHLNLMIQNKFDYSTGMIFSSLLYNC